jgi:SAM-dependent methyltransferase
MSNIATLQEIFWSLLDPWRFMATTLPFLYSIIRHLYSIGEFSILFSWQKLQYAWFSAFWLWFGPQLRANNGDRITALLEGRIESAQVTKSPVAPPVGGVVLDIGPGRGYWIDLYAKANIPVEKPGAKSKSDRDGIKKVYGVEPNPDSHAALSKRVEKIGLSGVYEVLPVGIEELGKVKVDGTDKSIKNGSVDCIVSILCLCSIPEPEKNIAELYGLLKKGGRWYLYEHVRTQDGLFMRWYQGKHVLWAGSWGIN